MSRTYSIIVALLGCAAQPKQLQFSPQWQLCSGARCPFGGPAMCGDIGPLFAGLIGIAFAC
jgi:hypothetical protein